jgi:transcriptional regulator with XRE-family HTH domain
MALKDNLKRLREQAGYAQAKDFSKIAGIPYSSYAPYERGSWPNENNLIKIAAALHVSIDELLGYDPTQTDKTEKIIAFFRRIGYSVNHVIYHIFTEEEKRPGYEIIAKNDYPFLIRSNEDLISLYNKIIFDPFSNEILDKQRYSTALEILLSYDKEHRDHDREKVEQAAGKDALYLDGSMIVKKLFPKEPQPIESPLVKQIKNKLK